MEDLIPEPNRLIHVIDADVNKRRRDRLSCSGVLGEETHTVGYFLTLHPAGGTYGVTLQKLRRYLCGTADAFEPLPGFRVNFLRLQDAARQKENHGALAFQHPRLREYPVLQVFYRLDYRFWLCP